MDIAAVDSQFNSMLTLLNTETLSQRQVNTKNKTNKRLRASAGSILILPKDEKTRNLTLHPEAVM
jgi:hypothetical protein